MTSTCSPCIRLDKAIETSEKGPASGRRHTASWRLPSIVHAFPYQSMALTASHRVSLAGFSPALFTLCVPLLSPPALRPLHALMPTVCLDGLRARGGVGRYATSTKPCLHDRLPLLYHDHIIRTQPTVPGGLRGGLQAGVVFRASTNRGLQRDLISRSACCRQTGQEQRSQAPPGCRGLKSPGAEERTMR